jgi:hypothetical protein
LRKKLDYDWTSEHFADHLAETLWINCPKVAAEDAQTLARHYVREEADAIQRINAMLGGIGMDFDDVLDGARADKAKELVHGYVRREPDAVTLVEELLAGANASIDTLTADRIRANLEWIERFDRLTAMAESRRNISLHEIERHRAGFAEALRRGVQAVEDAEFEVIETPARGKNAA